MGVTYSFKLVLFGNIEVGKTSIIERYINNRFEQEYLSTLGYNLYEKIIKMKDVSITFMIFDIGGQEKFEELRKKYAQGARAAFLVYDITNRDSFDNIKKWHADLIKFAENPVSILIGNKIDLEYKREVSKEEGENLAKEIRAGGFLETSAKDDIEIGEAFNRLAKLLI